TGCCARWELPPRRSLKARGRLLFGGPAVEVLVAGAGFGAGLVDRAVDVLGRAVDGVELERLLADADDVVARALRHDDAVVRLHLVHRAVDRDLALAGLDPEELVAVVVHFLADLVARL